MKRIVLIDGHNLLFRMFYGIPSKGNEIGDLDVSYLEFKVISNKLVDYKTYEIIEKIGES